MAGSSLLAIAFALLSTSAVALTLDAGQCSAAQCSTGYAGAGVDSCASDGGDFGLTGCSPMCVMPADTTGYVTTFCDTTLAAITASACSLTCASGYRTTGSGPSAACTSGFGTFTYSGCEAIPKCSLPSSTTGYNTGACDTSSTTLTEADCTVTCATNYAGAGADSCASDGGTFSLSGCDQACTLPSTTTGYTTSGCTGSRTSAQCSVTCASGYTGTAADSCPSAGGTHSLTGCSAMPTCNLPSSTTGYTATGCSGTTESQCSVTCASGYTGTAVDTCSSDGSDFVFSGCSLIPKCLLPASTTGYTPNNCGTTSASVTATQCSVTCATGYTGTGVDTCNSDGAEFAFTGCTAIPSCVLPSDSTGYTTTNCDTSGGALTMTQCTVGCAANYAGVAVDTCTSSGGTFALTGCFPQCSLPSPLTTGYVATSCSGSLVATSCLMACDSSNNYAGTALATCPSAAGTFSLSGCAITPKCTLPSSTPGYWTTACNPGRVDTYGIYSTQCTVACSAGYSGTAASACSSSGTTVGTFELTGCTRDDTCNLPSSTTGYKTHDCPTPGCGHNYLASTACAVYCDTGYTGTATDTCAVATGDSEGTFALSGCSPMCVRPTDTTGYVITFCDTTLAAITESACSLTCASGYRTTGSGPAASCSSGFGTFTFSGCEAIPKCTLPSDTTGYITSSCAASATALAEADCTVSCDTANGYGGAATDTCSTDGGTFALAGCTPACTLPSTTTGYTTSSCAGTTTSAQCTVTCASGYTGTGVDSCSAAGGTHALSGCTALPKCTLPSTTTGYTVVSGCGSSSTSVTADACSITCATGYTGTAVDSCPTDGGAFTFSGCTAIPSCTLPSDTTGYTPSNCGSTSTQATASQCSVSCATDYTGTGVDACNSDGGVFSFSGCTAIPKCSLPSDTTGYTTTSCDTSNGQLLASACTVGCASGYGGVAVDTCTTNGGTFALSGCSPSCSLPSSMPTGYTAISCSGTILPSACSVVCATDYTGTVVPTCPSSGGTFSFSGCTAVAKCTLPVSDPDTYAGYVTTACNPGRGSTYGITAAQCVTTCASGYSGTGAASCTLGSGETVGTMSLTGCTRDDVCELPSASTGYVTEFCSTWAGDCGSGGNSGDAGGSTGVSPMATLLVAVVLRALQMLR